MPPIARKLKPKILLLVQMQPVKVKTRLAMQPLIRNMEARAMDTTQTLRRVVMRPVAPKRNIFIKIINFLDI
jgi:hypothetical protein